MGPRPAAAPRAAAELYADAQRDTRASSAVSRLARRPAGASDAVSRISGRQHSSQPPHRRPQPAADLQSADAGVGVPHAAAAAAPVASQTAAARSAASCGRAGDGHSALPPARGRGHRAATDGAPARHLRAEPGRLVSGVPQPGAAGASQVHHPVAGAGVAAAAAVVRSRHRSSGRHQCTDHADTSDV